MPEYSSDWENLYKKPLRMRTLSYIPNPPPALSIIDKGDRTITSLKKADIIPANENYDWFSIPSYHYIHNVTLHANFRKDFLRNTNIEGYKCKRLKLSGEDRKRYIAHLRYLKGPRSFYIKFRKDTWKDPFTQEERYAFVGEVKLFPVFRSDLWTAVDWIESMLTIIENNFCVEPLRLHGIELPLDFKLTGFDAESLRPCLWMHHGDDLVVNNADGKIETDYYGSNKKRKIVKVYPKAGCFHIEPTWRDRAFRDNKSYQFFSIYSVLLFLINIYESTFFRYLDLYKLARSNKVRERAVNYWNMFVTEGLRFALDNMRRIEKYPNTINFASEHPFNACFKARWAETIQKGLSIAEQRTKSKNFLGKQNINALLKNKHAVKKVKELLERYARREARQQQVRSSRRG